MTLWRDWREVVKKHFTHRDKMFRRMKLAIFDDTPKPTPPLSTNFSSQTRNILLPYPLFFVVCRQIDICRKHFTHRPPAKSFFWIWDPKKDMQVGKTILSNFCAGAAMLIFVRLATNHDFVPSVGLWQGSVQGLVRSKVRYIIFIIFCSWYHMTSTHKISIWVYLPDYGGKNRVRYGSVHHYGNMYRTPHNRGKMYRTPSHDKDDIYL